MTKRLLVIIFLMAIVFGGCVKETYDLNKLSKRNSLSPTFGLPAVRGDVTLEDLAKPSDTIVYDDNKFMKLVIEKDSVFSTGLADFLDMDTLLNEEIITTIGVLRIAPFSYSLSYTLMDIVNNMNPVIGDKIKMLDGGTGVFPAFPAVQIDGKAIAVSNFEYATFASGSISVTIGNNLPAAINGLKITLVDGSTRYPVCNQLTFGVINSHSQASSSINLAGVTLTNNVYAEVEILGSPGAAGAAVDLKSTGISILLEGTNLLISSGKCIIPSQQIPDLQKNDTISVSVDDNMELVTLAIKRGDLNFEVNSDVQISTKVTFTMPTALKNDVAFSDSVVINQGMSVNNTMNLSDLTIDLASVNSQPYNLLPFNYDIEVGSDNQMIEFNDNSTVSLKYMLINPEIDYVKGFFGQREESLTADTMDINLDGLLENITGSVYLADPQIKLDYTNSFGVPITIGLNVKGIKKGEVTDLGYPPFTINYPVSVTDKEQTGSVVINKTNSTLPELISMVPEQLILGGSASMYSDEYPAGQRDSYVFGDSKIEGNLTVELPMEFRAHNLHFADTMDNFLNGNDDDNANHDVYYDDYGSESEDEGFSIADNFSSIEMKLSVDNGFPLEASASVVLYDSIAHRTLYTLDLPDVLSAAPVNAEGKVTSSAHSETTIIVDDEFLDRASDADKIILQFTLNTTGNGAENVKIYSDYSLSFDIAVIATTDIDLSLSKKEDR